MRRILSFERRRGFKSIATLDSFSGPAKEEGGRRRGVEGREREEEEEEVCVRCR